MTPFVSPPQQDRRERSCRHVRTTADRTRLKFKIVVFRILCRVARRKEIRGKGAEKKKNRSAAICLKWEVCAVYTAGIILLLWVPIYPHTRT